MLSSVSLWRGVSDGGEVYSRTTAPHLGINAVRVSWRDDVEGPDGVTERERRVTRIRLLDR